MIGALRRTTAAVAATLAGISAFAGTAAAAEQREASDLALVVEYDKDSYQFTKEADGTSFFLARATVSQGGGNVGTLGARCTSTAATTSIVIESCWLEVKFPDGADRIEIKANVPFNYDKKDLPVSYEGRVTGGSGKHEGASGKVDFTDKSLTTTEAVL